MLCAIPGRDLPNISWLALLAFDKWVHAGIFFVLVLLFLRANVLELKSQIVVARMGLAAMIVYGGLLEVMQGALFEERTADVYDFIANSFGAVLGFVLFSRLIKKFPILIRPIMGYADDAVVATARIVAPGVSYDEVSIGRVATAASHRGTGAGKDLMRVCLQTIADRYGEVPVRISAQSYLQRFYESFGFHRTAKPEYLEDDIPHAEMLRLS
ncbi:MAG: GNAT family N-acetyltransferase [Bacteroidetes bacterium]|nr:GNAT family N-acetyltransferase [Bacteroidota bacterium]